MEAARTTTAPGAAEPAEPAAAHMWGLGGAAYDRVSFAISDALAHAAQRLNPKPGERHLDVATGTGWSARNLAAAGARVAAVDFSPALLEAARRLSAHLDPPIDFRLAEAERLPFEEAAFDGVISTFGVMFAAEPERAAAELARVCRPGGRLALATWAPDGSVAAFFGLIGAHTGAPPPEPSPLAWGDPERLQALLGTAFELDFEQGVSEAFHDDVDDVWSWYARGFGPVRQLVETLDAERLAAFRRDLEAYHRHYETPAGRLRIRREYLVTVGRRR